MTLTRTACRSIALLALLLAGCTAGPRPDGRLATFLEAYRTKPHYRAFAVARGTSSNQSYGLGWAYDGDNVRQAIDVAMAYCDRDADASLLGDCKLYQLGDIQVYDMDADELAIAECLYTYNTSATSIEGVTLANCRASQGPASAGGRNLDDYRSAPAYRALAATGDPRAPATTLGWGSDEASIDAAIAAARQDCEARRLPNQAACELHAIGDIAVAGVSPIRVERAKCLVILDPASRSLEGPNAARCAAAASGLQAPEPGTVPPQTLDAAEVRSKLVGNTLLSLGGTSAYVQLAPDGHAGLRSARDPLQDNGTWRIDDKGQLCLRWQAGAESCAAVTRTGSGYDLGGTSYALVKGNPLEL